MKIQIDEQIIEPNQEQLENIQKIQDEAKRFTSALIEKEKNRASALEKLLVLGLTEDEIAAL